jgi:hypothetical protein
MYEIYDKYIIRNKNSGEIVGSIKKGEARDKKQEIRLIAFR